MIDKSKMNIGNKRIAELIKCKTFVEIKTTVEAFLTAVDEVSNESNGMLVWGLCHELAEALSEWAKPYSIVPRRSKTNTVFVPPEHAPLMLLKSYVPINGSPNDIIDALKNFIDRCDEFVLPICDAISVAEMNRVLNAAQKAYRLFDIIAPKEPLMILRFDCSHIIYNSQCGLSDNKERPATVMVYHPRAVDIHDRVFIFAHELGHALHQALTGNVEITPDGFDKFNEPYSPKPITTKDMQECFADAVAHAILNIKGLGTHFPSQWSKDISPDFARYLRSLCENRLINMGVYSEPLPPVNPMLKAGFEHIALLAQSR